jgi:phenylacetate-CoA ligase
MNEWCHRNLVYPAILRLLGEQEMYSELDRMRQMQWAPAAEVERSQTKKLTTLLNYAARHCRFYQSNLDGLYPVSNQESRDVLKSLPLLSKEDLQTYSSELRAEAKRFRTTLKTTGGSTGQPVSILKDRGATARERAATWMAYGWFGLQPGDRGARFWGSPRAMGRRRLRFAVADIAMNRVRFSAFGVSEADLGDYWRQCLEFKPRYFYGYVSMIESFARHLQTEGLDGSLLNLKAIITTSEVLTQAQRELVEEVFSAPVQNEYGCGEVGPIAYECEAGSMHEMSENVLIEVLDEYGQPVDDGVEGDVVVTDLNNRAMPLLRYRVMDRAIRVGACCCGRGLPVLGEITGRVYDKVIAPDGRFYHGEYFMYLFEDIRDQGHQFDRFRVIQESRTNLIVEVQLQHSNDTKISSLILDVLKQDLSDMEIRIELTTKIDLPESGKLRIVENRST